MDLDRKEKFFIVGGAGFIGSHFCDALWRVRKRAA